MRSIRPTNSGHSPKHLFPDADTGMGFNRGVLHEDFESAFGVLSDFS